jgi:CRISPR system Cascade subunit CasA
MPDFNLVDEKWISCVTDNGSIEEMSLKEVLVNAHKIKEITDTSSLVSVSLHRLFLAILHRVFGPDNIEEWQKLWNARQWDEGRLSAYLDKWRHRFNLFDDVRPFYQSRELNNAEQHPVLHLAMEIASGNNATLFNHNADDEPSAISPAVAARYVIATQAYSIGFGKSHPFYFSDSPLIRGFTTMALGNSLFETLALNLIEYNEDLPFPWTDEDLPIWEQDKPAEANHSGTPVHGYLDYLTWQSRSIHLFPEGNLPYVRFCQIQQNLKLPKQQYLDPFKCFQKVEKGLIPLGIKPDRATWRDSHALFQRADDSFKRPEIFNWLGRIENRRRNGQIQARPSYNLTVTGLATDQGKAASVLLWRHERLPLPLVYLEDEKLIAKLKEALDMSEYGGRLLGPGPVEVAIKGNNVRLPSPMHVLAQELLPQGQKGRVDRNAVKSFIDSLSPARPYWARLGMSFNRLVGELAKDKSAEGEYGAIVLPWWAGEVRLAARQAFEEATNSFDRSGRLIKAVTKARDEFDRRLNTILKPYKENERKGGEEA